jgi:hypothetical protein
VEACVSATNEQIAQAFHEEYERLAPGFGYETRRDSAVPWDKVPPANRNLMIATVAQVMARMQEPNLGGFDDDEADGSFHDGGWLLIRLPKSLHVIPGSEEGHMLSAECWCEPERDDDTPPEMPQWNHRDELERLGVEDPE